MTHTKTYGEEDPEFVEHLKEAWPGLSDEDMMSVLHGCTAFMFGDVDLVVKQLREAYAMSGGNIHAAHVIADLQMDVGMAQARLTEAHDQIEHLEKTVAQLRGLLMEQQIPHH